MIFSVRRKVKDFNKKITKALVYCVFLIPVFYVWASFSNVMLFLFLPMVLSFMILPFRDDIIEHFCLEQKSVSKINDDDVIALEFMSEKTKRSLGLWRKTLTGPEIKRFKALAKKARVKSVPVCENLPKFVPFIFLSLIINLLLGDVLLYFLINF